MLKDFESFLAKTRAALPGTRIVYISINPSIARWKQEAKILETNRLIEQFIREHDEPSARLAYIESHSKLLGDDGKPRSDIYRPDGLHLNQKGYELWTAIVKPAILRLAAD